MSNAIAKLAGKAPRLVIAVEGTPIAVRIVPHLTNPEMVVLKAAHPEVGALVAKLAGVEAGKTWKGSNFWITECPKAALVAALGVFGGVVGEMEAGGKPAALPAPTNCPECGTVDGTHFQYCGKNNKNLH